MRPAGLSDDAFGKASSSTNLVWIDHDAAGLGWSNVDRKGYELLSTVTHELGHMIGLDHDSMGDSLEMGRNRHHRLAARVDQVRATDDLFAGRLKRHSDSLSGSLNRAISRRSAREDVLAEESQDVSRISIDQFFFATEESWATDDLFEEENRDDESSEKWLENVATQL